MTLSEAFISLEFLLLDFCGFFCYCSCCFPRPLENYHSSSQDPHRKMVNFQAFLLSMNIATVLFFVVVFVILFVTGDVHS